MTTRKFSVTTKSEREWRVAEAIHSGEMEGLHVTPEGREDAEDYIVGRISSDELMARTLTRYGLA